MFESESTQFVASPRTKEYKLRPVFHYPPNHPFSCQWSQELNPSNWQKFTSREDARSDGYEPCAECGIDSEPERTQFVASPRTKDYKLRPVFHYPPNHPSSCQWSQELNPSHWQEFNSREDARSDGYEPCAECGIDSN